jgi:hypothetical protein
LDSEKAVRDLTYDIIAERSSARVKAEVREILTSEPTTTPSLKGIPTKELSKTPRNDLVSKGKHGYCYRQQV